MNFYLYMIYPQIILKPRSPTTHPSLNKRRLTNWPMTGSRYLSKPMPSPSPSPWSLVWGMGSPRGQNRGTIVWCDLASVPPALSLFIVHVYNEEYTPVYIASRNTNYSRYELLNYSTYSRCTIPSYIREIQTYCTFKSNLKKWRINSQTCQHGTKQTHYHTANYRTSDLSGDCL